MRTRNFIELHSYDDGSRAAIAIDEIRSIYERGPDDEWGCKIVFTTMSSSTACFYSKEKYDEIKQKITDAGSDSI